MKKRKVFLKDIIAQSPEKEYGQLYADIMLELSQGTRTSESSFMVRPGRI